MEHAFGNDIDTDVDTHLESRLVVFLHIVQFLLNLIQGLYTNRPISEDWLIRECIVETDGSKVGLEIRREKVNILLYRVPQRTWDSFLRKGNVTETKVTWRDSHRLTMLRLGSNIYTSTASPKALRCVLMGIALNLTVNKIGERKTLNLDFGEEFQFITTHSRFH
jgi:hypothetical protein